MRWKVGLFVLWPLALLTLCWPAVAEGQSVLPAPSLSVRQGFSPYGIALTRDGRYAYLSFDLSAFVFKVRLSDMTVVASADFSRYFPLKCSTIVLDAGETRVFLHDRILGRLLVLNAVTLQEIRVIGGLQVGMAQLVSSRWGPYLILVRESVWFINTDTLEVTALGNSRRFSKARESATDPAIWYAVAPGPEGTVIGTYDYKKALWSPKAIVQPRAGGWSVHDFAVLPDGSKAYLAVLGPWLPGYQATGWLYAADLRSGTVRELPIDGGALPLAISHDSSRLYVGAGWPARGANDVPMIHIVDTARDADIGVINIGKQKFDAFCTQINEMKIDPVNGRWMYATSSDGNSLIKVDLATNQVAVNLVLNEESNSPSLFVRQLGASRAYVLLARTNEALEIDLDRAEVTRTVQFPLTTDGRISFLGAAFRDADTLLVPQGNYVLELAADLTLRAKRNLPSGTPGVWRAVGSRDGRTLYAVSKTPGTNVSDTLLAIDTTSFQIRAPLKLDGGNFNQPWEHPDAGKLYVLGGMQNTTVLIHVVDAASHTLRRTIRFDNPDLPGISAGPHYPYAYDPGSRTLYAGATSAVLAIDTDRDEIKRVIRLDAINAALGLSGDEVTTLNAVGLTFHPVENRLYMAHSDGSFVSVYDLAGDRFLPQLIHVKGYMPGWQLANDDVSKIWVANRRSDSLSVIDTKTLTVEKVIDIHACNPYPGRVDFAAGGQTSQTVTLSGLTTTGKCTVSTTAGWLSATPVGSAAPQTFNVSVDPSVFGPGTYQGTVAFQSANLVGSALDAGLKVGSGVSSVRIASVADGAGFGPVIAPGSWAAVFGSNLAPATRTWRAEEIVEDVLPTRLEGTGVTVNGRDAAVYVVSPSQVDFQVPGGLSPGAVDVQVTNNGSPSNTVKATLAASAPELFRFLLRRTPWRFTRTTASRPSRTCSRIAPTPRSARPRRPAPGRPSFSTAPASAPQFLRRPRAR
jgi:YVTN family beta-propeller protein